MTPDLSNPQETANSNVDAWKAYIRLALRLKTTNPEQYETVPELLKQLVPDAINSLNVYDIQALQAANALPPGDAYQITPENIQAARAYLRLIQKLKTVPVQYATFPAILRSISENDDEIENLDADYLQALRYMNVLPEPIVPSPKIKPQEPNQAEKIIPKLHDRHSSREPYPDPIATIEKIGEIYNEAADNMLHSIEKSNDAFGNVFRKAGGGRF